MNKTRQNELELYRSIFGDTPSGCRDHDNCFTCPYPACKFDGYHPNFKYKSFKRSPWTERELEHLKELLNTDMSYKTLSNIFGREICDIKAAVDTILE